MLQNQKEIIVTLEEEDKGAEVSTFETNETQGMESSRSTASAAATYS